MLCFVHQESRLYRSVQPLIRGIYNIFLPYSARCVCAMFTFAANELVTSTPLLTSLPLPPDTYSIAHTPHEFVFLRESITTVNNSWFQSMTNLSLRRTRRTNSKQRTTTTKRPFPPRKFCCATCYVHLDLQLSPYSYMVKISLGLEGSCTSFNETPYKPYI